jgi:hypothetical protein
MCLVLMWSKVNLVGTKTRNEKGSSNRTLNLRRRSEINRIASKYRKERGEEMHAEACVDWLWWSTCVSQDGQLGPSSVGEGQSVY